MIDKPINHGHHQKKIEEWNTPDVEKNHLIS